MSRVVAPASSADYHILGTQAVHSLGEMDDEQNLQGGPSVLDDADKIRASPIQWGGVDGLSSDERNTLEKFDKMRANRQNFLQESGSTIIDLYLRVLSKSTRVEVLQYIVTVVMDIFIEFGEFSDLICKRAGSWMPFWNLVRMRSTSDHPYIVYQSSRILSRILATGDIIPADEATFYVEWLRTLLKSQDNSVVELSLNCLRRILRRDSYRLLFFVKGVEDVRAVLINKHVTMQLQYLSSVILWVLSFNPIIASKMDIDEQHVIAAIVATVRTAKKDKIIRMSLGALRNLVEQSGHKSVENGFAIRRRYCTLIISLKFLPILQSWIDQKSLPDEDSVADAEFLKTHLEETYTHMSTFDQYHAELHSGELSWTPAHRSDQFWGENAPRLNENNYALLKILIQILKSSDQAEMLAVAAHDVGEYIRYYPRGKSVVESLGGKTAIMSHMVDHPDAAVRYEALVAIQKIMTHNWEFLGNATKDKPAAKA
jgi:V-type H+-transporting ATPase subunit H